LKVEDRHMRNARALYESLGFREIPPYRHNPTVRTAFLCQRENA
jgi:hypothetical protein